MINIKEKVKSKIKNPLVNRVFSAILFGAGGAIISKALLMFFNIIVARLISQTDYGVYSLINNTVQTFTIFATAGLGAALSRYVALHREKNKEQTGILVTTLLIFNVMIAFIVSIIMFVFAEKISLLISEKVNISNYLKITSLTIFFTSIATTLQSTLQGFEKFNKVALYQLVSNLILITIGSFLVCKFKLTGAIIALLVLNFSLLILFLFSVINILKNKTIKMKFKLDDTVKEGIKNAAIPAFLATIFVVPLLWVTNSYFIKAHGYDEFAAFSACLQWFVILNYIPQQLGQVKPIYTQLFDENKLKDFKNIAFKMILYSFLYSLFVAIVLGIGSSLILKMYGKNYLGYKLPFIIMLISSVVFSVQSQFGSIFFAIGKMWLNFILNAIWAIMFIFIFMLINSKGVIGYTLTYLISYALYTLVSVICFYNILKKKKESMKLG